MYSFGHHIGKMLLQSREEQPYWALGNELHWQAEETKNISGCEKENVVRSPDAIIPSPQCGNAFKS